MGARRAGEGARFGVKAMNRALDGIAGPTVVHICLGYGPPVRNKPSGYAFLPQLAEFGRRTDSIEAAQPRLDLGVLQELAGKTILLGVLDLGDTAVETAEQVAARLRAGLRPCRGRASGGRPRLRHEIPAARARFGKLQALVEGAAIVRKELGA